MLFVLIIKMITSCLAQWNPATEVSMSVGPELEPAMHDVTVTVGFRVMPDAETVACVQGAIAEGGW